MKVIVACEYSGIVRDAFLNRGHAAISCDIIQTEYPGPHLLQDIRELNLASFDLMIAHPPCTYLCNSGVRWLHTEEGRWEKMKEAAEFFKYLLHAPVKYRVIENPIMHKYAVDIIGRRQDQIIQPWQFGHGETKATGLWIENLPPLQPTNIVEGRENRIHRMPPSKNRGKDRSKTYTGIAEAMAEQWGGYVEDRYIRLRS